MRVCGESSVRSVFEKRRWESPRVIALNNGEEQGIRLGKNMAIKRGNV